VAACATASPAPESSLADACAAYGEKVRPPLARMGAAADRFADRMALGTEAGARASRELAATLDVEHGVLAGIAPARVDIAAAHGRMLAAVEDLAGAMRFLGDTLATKDELRREPARTRLRLAEARWRDAVAGVKDVCP
jgi:hypothetical protein